MKKEKKKDKKEKNGLGIHPNIFIAFMMACMIFGAEFSSSFLSYKTFLVILILGLVLYDLWIKNGRTNTKKKGV